MTDEQIILDTAYRADDPNQLDFDRLRSYFQRAVVYALPNATGSREGWRTASVEELAEWTATFLVAGISPTLHEHAVESGVQVARQFLADERAKNGA
jgi:hypothetical protein